VWFLNPGCNPAAEILEFDLIMFYSVVNKIWDLIIHGSINNWTFYKLFLYKKIILMLLSFWFFSCKYKALR
jgi:hypothetical protein